MEDRLIALNDLPAEAETLRPYLADSSAAVLAKAARRVRDARVPGLEAVLNAALERAFDNGAKTDPGGAAKLALLEALDHLDAVDPLPFRRAACYRQPEPAFGDFVDTALDVRIRAALARGEVRPEGAVELLVDFHRRRRNEDAEDAEAAQVALELLRSDAAREYLARLEPDA